MNDISKYHYYSNIACNPSLKVPYPIPNATLITVLLFIRHGIRSPAQKWNLPGNEGYWNCNGISQSTKFPKVFVNGKQYNYYHYDQSKNYLFPPSCEKSSLTDEGVWKLNELGHLYYKYSLMNNIISSTNFSNVFQIFSIRSSFVIRCIESALSFLNGFFSQFNGSINQPLHIETGEENDEPLAPSPFRSKIIYNHLLDYLKKENYENRLNKSEKIIEKFRKYLNISYPVHQFESLSFGDYINTLRCSKQEENVIRSINHTIPTEENLITPEIHKELMENVYFLEGNFYKSSKSSTIGPIFRLILEKLKKIKSKNPDHIFNLFSGHSETLSALLTGFGIKNEFTPPFGSHFLIEAWKSNNSQIFLRVALNGEVLKIVPIKEFKKYAKSIINEWDDSNLLIEQSTTSSIEQNDLNNSVSNQDFISPNFCLVKSNLVIPDHE